MSKAPLPKLYAHSFGLGDICVHPSGKYIYTCGSDGEIRVHNENLTQPKTLDYQHTSALMGMALSSDGKQMAVCAEDKQVVILDAIEGGSEFTSPTTVTRFSHAATCASFSPSGLQLACGGDGSELRIVNVHDPSNAIAVKGVVAGARHISYDPAGQYLAIADACGSLRIQDVKAGAQGTSIVLPIMSEVKHAPKTVMAMQQRLGFSWSPDGSVLALPSGTQGEIKALKRGEWNEAYTLKPQRNYPVSLVKFSPSGRYLAAVYPLEGTLHIWDTQAKNSIATLQIDPDSPPISMSWSPVGNSLYFYLASGHISRWSDPVPSHLPLPAAAPAPKEVESKSINSPLKRMTPLDKATSQPSVTNKETEHESKGVSVTDLFQVKDDSDSEGESDGASLSRSKAGDDDGFSRRRGSSKRTQKSSSSKMSRGMGDGSGSESDDDDQVKSKNKVEGLSRPTTLLKYLEAVPSDAAATPIGLQQRPFQSGTTHSSATVRRCFLAWNLVGTVECLNQDNLFNTITITFADSSRRRITLTDHRGFTLCSLGDHGAVFAAPGSEAPHHVSPVTQENRSVVSYHPFDSWASGSDWSIELPDDEHAEAVAAGDTWIAVATSMMYVRLFSYSGIQLSLFSISGPVVSMIGEEDRLCVIHHSPSVPRQGQQALELVDLRIEDGVYTKSQGIPVPLSPYSSLMWLGFSDSNKMLITCDTQSVFRALSSSQGNTWVPVLDARQNAKGERPWPIAFTEGSILCILGKPLSNAASLQSAMKSFSAAPASPYFPLASASEARPVATKLSLQLPVCISTPVDKALEQVYRSRIFDREQSYVTGVSAPLKNQLVQDAQLLHMIKNHAKDNQARALDLCTRLNNTKSLAKAVDIVNELRQYPALVERMSVILRARQAEPPTVQAVSSDAAPKSRALAGLSDAMHTVKSSSTAVDDLFGDDDMSAKKRESPLKAQQLNLKRISK